MRAIFRRDAGNHCDAFKAGRPSCDPMACQMATKPPEGGLIKTMEERRKNNQLITRDESKAALMRIGEALHQQFDAATHGSRLQQLDAALATAAMSAEHLFDEELREADLAKRVMSRAKVHGDNEVSSPVDGRSLNYYAAVAERNK